MSDRDRMKRIGGIPATGVKDGLEQWRRSAWNEVLLDALDPGHVFGGDVYGVSLSHGLVV